MLTQKGLVIATGFFGVVKQTQNMCFKIYIIKLFTTIKCRMFYDKCFNLSCSNKVFTIYVQFSKTELRSLIKLEHCPFIILLREWSGEFVKRLFEHPFEVIA